MSILFKGLNPPVPSVTYRHKGLKDAAHDLTLLSNCTVSELDVAEDAQGRIILVQLSKIQRLVNWILGENSHRIARLKAYGEQALVATDLGLNRFKTTQYYKSIAGWTTGADVKIQQQYQASKEEYERVLQETPNAKSELAQKKWEMLYIESQLANEFKAAGSGVNGARLGQGLDGRTIMVRKDHEKDPRLVNEGTTLIFRSQEEVCRNDPRQAEAVAFEASDFFDFDVVPPTNTDERGHSYQEFVEGGQSAKHAAVKTIANLTPDEIEKLQTMAIFDYLIGDLDGHDNNWNVHFDIHGQIQKVVKFDNGNSFPEKPLDKIRDHLTLDKTYAWKAHLWAKQKLNPSSGSKLEKILNKLILPENQIEFWVRVQKKYPNFVTTERVKLMSDRIALIAAARSRRLSIADLGEIYHSQDLALGETLFGAILEATITDYFQTGGDHSSRKIPPPNPSFVAQATHALENHESQVVAALRAQPKTKMALQAERYRKAMQVFNEKEMRNFLVLFLLGVLPSLVYFLYLQYRNDREMEKIRNEILGLPIIDPQTLKDYQEFIRKLRREGSDISAFPDPAQKEKKNKLHAFSYALKLVGGEELLTALEQNHSLPLMITVLQNNPGPGTEEFLKFVKELEHLEMNPDPIEDVGALSFIAAQVGAFTSLFNDHKKPNSEIKTCFELMQQFLERPDSTPFSISVDFMLGFVNVFCNHQLELTQKIQSTPANTTREALWKEISDELSSSNNG